MNGRTNEQKKKAQMRRPNRKITIYLPVNIFKMDKRIKVLRTRKNSEFPQWNHNLLMINLQNSIGQNNNNNKSSE